MTDIEQLVRQTSLLGLFHAYKGSQDGRNLSSVPSGHTITSKSKESTVKTHLSKKPNRQANTKRSRSARAPRKPKTTGKVEKPVIPKLTAPLSELTTDYHHIPVRDMEEWVHRPVEVRWMEVKKREGYIARPMNSFMLYRSAYAERTKFWCLQNNHQVVSSVSGVSWPLEPPSVRNRYNELARIERMNHQAAHPGYKFSPSKFPDGKKRKTPKKTGDNTSVCEINVVLNEHPLMLGETDVGSNHAGELKNGSRSAKNSWMYLGFPYDKTIGGPEISSFQHSNPGVNTPRPISLTELSGQYYRTTIFTRQLNQLPYPMASTAIEDISICPTNGPSSTGFSGSVPIDPGLEKAHTTFGDRSIDIQEVLKECLKSDKTLANIECTTAVPCPVRNELNRPDGRDIDVLTTTNEDSIYEFPPYCAETAVNMLYDTQSDEDRHIVPQYRCFYDLDHLMDMDFDYIASDHSMEVRKLPDCDPIVDSYLSESCDSSISISRHQEEPLCYDEWLE